jgi:hypothetical protein
MNYASNSLYIRTAGCQPLLQTLSFAQHRHNMFQQADYMHSLVLILWPKPHSICPCCPAASTVCVTFTFAEPQKSLPKNAHDHCNDLLKHFIKTRHNFTHVSTEIFYCFLGGLPALQLSFALLYRLCTDHPCFNCSDFLPGSSFHNLLFNYANRTRIIFSGKILFISCFVLLVYFCQACPIFHRHATAVNIDFCRILLHHSSPCISDATLFWRDLSHTPFFPCILFSHFLFL